MIDRFIDMLDNSKIKSFKISKTLCYYNVEIDDVEYKQNENENVYEFFERVHKCIKTDIEPINMKNYISFLESSNYPATFDDIKNNCTGFIKNPVVTDKGTVLECVTREYKEFTLRDVKYLYCVEETNNGFKIRGIFK